MTRDAANPLSAASQALADKSRRLTPPRMVSCLFGRAPVEDLAQYTPDALALRSRPPAHEHLMAPRRPGQLGYPPAGFRDGHRGASPGIYRGAGRQ